MAKHDQYHIDYEKLYPGIGNRPEILKVLEQSDRKMKYMEYDLKTGQPHRSRETGNRVVLLAREDSLERLQEEGQEQFPDITTLEELTDVREDIRLLRHALLELEEKELNLIISLYYKGLSEREYSQKTGIPQRTINDRKHCILAKLKKILENHK